jgi:hypothetical protein
MNFFHDPGLQLDGLHQPPSQLGFTVILQLIRAGGEGLVHPASLVPCDRRHRGVFELLTLPLLNAILTVHFSAKASAALRSCMIAV